jgi:hypothetical protein
MFVLPFLLYTYMSQQNFSTVLNTTAISEWSSSLPQWANPTQWAYPTHWVSPTTLPTITLPPTPDITPYAVFYFLSGAVFFLGSAYMVLATPRSPSFTALDGIATMSDFTKTSLRKHLDDFKPSRELATLIKSNGMTPEEFLDIILNNHKRVRRSSTST